VGRNKEAIEKYTAGCERKNSSGSQSDGEVNFAGLSEDKTYFTG
jgi:hypothetical protein